MKKIILPIILLVIVLAVVISCVSNDKDDPKVESADSKTISEESQAGNKSTVVRVGEKLTTGGLEITFVSVSDYESENMFLKPKAGKKYIRLFLEYKNVGESDHYVSEFDFKCYADDVACQTPLVSDEALSGEISAGRTTKGYVYFEVPENAEHIEVEYDLGWLTNEKAIFLVK